MRKKDRILTIKEFELKHKKLFDEWNRYYKEFAISEFDSLIDYREMIYWDTVEIQNDEGKDLKRLGLYKFLVNEIEYQLKNDKENNYYKKELLKQS